ncbi:inhibitor of nuclear factor kappa-B kinase subunit beta [Epargyreus clarus]|uniref:inhibitor of nuclear factor kappa-B kinase subunit beta n=1 Tax=Epargyreus clarus TaxID=520877 RepID=UPI003C2C55DF
MDDIVFIGDWIKDRVLGSGSFGIVVLWRHKDSDEKLAVKTCKWADELTAKHRERWTKEVEMLQSCNNPNIVGTRELPPEFVSGLARANPSRLPILCMEYCSGGDLRQVLNKPDSCCGLKEVQVRKILSDVGNAMQFLHHNKITHRDLKPENIVLQVPIDDPQNQAKVTYKLIDLGYAKEIDSNSVCASFVGTLQYLAPELLYSKTYSNSVDFWSLGLLAFEIICGTRPFLPFMAPVQWMPHVKKKAHENICVYETFHGDIEYSNEIFPENRISKPFKKFMEEWLQVALEWDPKLRGRDAPSKVTFNIPTEEKGMASKVVIFNLLQNILSRKIIQVFSITTLTHLAYEINESTTISMLKMWMHNDTNILPQDQIVLSKLNYVDIGDDEPVVKYWNEISGDMLYLYNKKQILEENVAPLVPKAVQRCLEHHKALYNFKNCLNLYKNGLYFVMNQMDIYDSLVNGLFVIAESLKNRSSQLLLKHNTVDKASGKLLAKEELMTSMIETGKKHVKHLRENNVGINLLGGFDEIFKETADTAEKIEKLQTAWSQLSRRLQSSARRCTEGISNDLNNFIARNNYQNVFINALKAYKKSYNGNRERERQCPEIVKFCYDCLKLRNKILHELHHQQFLYKIKDLNIEIPKIADAVTNAADNVEKLTNNLVTISTKLTNCIWSTISLVVTDPQNVAELPYSVVSFEKKDFKIGESVSNHCFKVANKMEDDSLKSLITESLKLRHSHINLCEKLTSQQKSLKKNMYDFSFLNEKS